ncbi:UbiA family prenyltransferase [Polymorphospora sp. NPDC051019]|uniref:UbiA family prenyltransferase n=1 Tax=Polymorphospora sp. NPDC051019 TaxID=3155725 RepID=UPI003428B336
MRDRGLGGSLSAHVRTWRPYTLWYVGLVGLAGAALATDRHTVPRLAAAWLVPTLIWVAAHYLGDYLDRDLDALSKPQRPIPSGQMRPSTALTVGAALAAAAGVIAVGVNPLSILVLVVGIGGAVAYNGLFKTRGLWGNLVRGALTGAAFLFGQLMTAPHPLVELLPFVLVFWAHDAASNLVGTLRDVSGDRAGGYLTFAVRHGVRRATWTAVALYGLAVTTAMAAVLVVPGARLAYLCAVLLATGLGCHAFGMLFATAREPTPSVALRSHEVLVAERLVLGGALLVPPFGLPVALGLVGPMLAVTLVTQRAMRPRHEFPPADRERGGREPGHLTPRRSDETAAPSAGGPGPERVAAGSVPADRTETAVRQATTALFALQRPDGSWPNRRPTAVLGTAGALAALHFADPERSRDLIERGARWLLENRNADGGWGGVAGAPTQIVPTVVAASTLRLLNPQASAEPVRRALDLVASRGGPAALADPGMVHMASMFLMLAGLTDMAGARRIPLELLLLPRALWRARLSFRVAPFVAMAFVQARHQPPTGLPRLLYRLARPAGIRVLAEVERGENDRGGYGGDNWLVAVVCIGLTCADAPRHMIRDTVGYLRSNVHTDGSWHIMQGLDLIGGSFVARGLAEAGSAADPRLARARQWLRACQQDAPFPVFGSPPGGWGWEGPRGWPNFLDSANVLAALVAGDQRTGDEHLRRGLRWLESRQDRPGSWGTFVPDTTLPNDGPCPYVTAQSLEVLLEAGVSPEHPRIRRALNWLLARQREDGTYDALWYRGRVPGTAMALVALSRAGLAGHPVSVRAREALTRAQLPDGSWGPGETGVLGDDPSTGTVEETAWALRALLASGVPADEPIVWRAADWIMAAQKPDGLWPAAPVCMHIRNFAYYVDGLIVNGLALKALGSYRTALAGVRFEEQGTV